MKEKVRYMIPITVFMILIFGITIWTFVKEDSEKSQLENRYLASMPKLSGDSLFDGSFGRDYENYLSDQFILRSKWISLKSRSEALLGKNDINQIYLAKDNYLIKKYTSASFDKKLVKENINELSKFVNKYLMKMGDEHIKVMLAPSAAMILNDYLPKYAEPFDETALIHRVKDSFASDNLVDVTDSLKEHKDEYIYFKTDHHWTALGAYYAYTQWAESCGITPLPLEQFTKETVSNDFLGTNHSKIVYADSKDTFDIYKTIDMTYEVAYDSFLEDAKEKKDSVFAMEHLGEKDKYPVFLDGNHGIVDIKTSKSNGKHLLVIKDSYAHAMLPFVINHYERVTVVDTRYMRKGIESLEISENFTDILVLYSTIQFMSDDTLFMLNFE